MEGVQNIINLINQFSPISYLIIGFIIGRITK
jgi:hypothetical protein